VDGTSASAAEAPDFWRKAPGREALLPRED
jgi:hypothetical protein